MAISRVIRIISYGEGLDRFVAVVTASSLKQGLQHYWSHTLKSYGYTDPIYTGNTLTVKDLQGLDRFYRAEEAKK